MYYQIDEALARQAKEVSSFSDYVPGSATQAYREQVDKAAGLAEMCKVGKDDDARARIDHLLDTYSRRLAENLNAQNRNAASCPSVLIAGPARFPVKKKMRQNDREDRLMAEYNEIQGLLDKMRSVGTGGIQSGDPDALDKLRKKLADREELQERMKAVNAYYRKNHTLNGCPQLSGEQIEQLKSIMASDWRADPRPFEAYQLSNNNSEIHRLRQRIAALEAAKAAPEKEEEHEGYTYRENSETMRVQFLFDGKPDEEIRTLLKSEGFRWAPSQGAWQRQLTAAGRAAATRVRRVLDKQ